MASRPAQFSAAMDRRLIEVDARIGDATTRQEAATKDFDEAWKEAFDDFDEMGLIGEGAKFIAPSGFTMQRTRSLPSAKLDSDLLRKKVVEHYQKALGEEAGLKKAEEVWETICRRNISVTADRIFEALAQKLSKRKAQEVWLAITEPTPDHVLLEEAVRHFRLPQDLVEACIIQPPATFSRRRQPWSKEDLEVARAYGFADPLPTNSPPAQSRQRRSTS